MVSFVPSLGPYIKPQSGAGRKGAMQSERTDTVLNETCPWSGKPVEHDSLTDYRGHTVGFCNPGCRDKFRAALQIFDGLVAAAAARNPQG
jgi:hypothetical protein